MFYSYYFLIRFILRERFILSFMRGSVIFIRFRVNQQRWRKIENSFLREFLRIMYPTLTKPAHKNRAQKKGNTKYYRGVLRRKARNRQKHLRLLFFRE